MSKHSALTKIVQFYTRINESATEECTYCKGLKANSIPYKINLIKVKNVVLDNRGPLQHRAGYNRKEVTIAFPRSQKAFIVHSISSIIKSLSIILSLIFFPVHSFLWRFFGGIILGWFLSSFVYIITNTRSKSAFLFSYGIFIKIALWLSVFIFLSNFYRDPLNITISDYIMFSVVILFFADAVLEQFIKIPKRIHIFKPLVKHYKKLDAYFNDNYQLYLEIPIWTTIYPFIRWIF